MLTIGLTGGIGSGKSTVSALLRERGLTVIDADQIARDIVEPDQPAFAELVAHFGEGIIGDDGHLNRPELARLAFAAPEETAVLNQITHPRITEETARRFAEAAARGERAVVYDMPLLIENGHDKDMDLVVVVEVDRAERIRRLVQTRGLAEEDVRRRMAAQASDGERRAAADVVIDNNGAIADLEPAIDALLERIDQYAS
ncbi:dephospho-CoA kinase [Corynebacterium uropygiale]|uniref:Dephospho-CoA kinase n=1 Tax=Corynebacterium uropygiale TaxID=1775911 RepID=A0A9X1TY92_9CORY|nr:dephospho-CoA kinase [Corynebacterium uropygiale]MCF4007040.1 dephospho-CoA kinase [Corynebacterium uropygiale]